MNSVLITITGPSCAGKTTLEASLVKKGLHRLLSTTTRAPRRDERDGKDYRFVSAELFKDGLIGGEFTESVEFNGHYYGLLRGDVMETLNKGSAVVVVEPEGKRQIEAFAKENDISLLRIFVTNPQEVILARFLERFGHDFTQYGDKAVERYTARLMTMLTVETGWHMGMNDKEYDLIFPVFDAVNATSVLQKIGRLLATKQG